MAGATLVDANVLLDVLTDDPAWGPWSTAALAGAAETGPLAQLPWEAAFLAGKAFMRYRRSGGVRTSTLPDFFIGAHAAVADVALLTRDVGRYGTHFPTVRLITPDR